MWCVTCVGGGGKKGGSDVVCVCLEGAGMCIIDKDASWKLKIHGVCVCVCVCVCV